MLSPEQMAKQLGLAISPLFPSDCEPLPGEHFAMLDGRRASFAFSAVDTDQIGAEASRNWRWSSDLPHHVLVGRTEIQVRSGREQQVRNFSRESVERKLDEFLSFLDSSRSTLPDVVSFLVGEMQQLWSSDTSLDGNQALSLFLLALCASGESDPRILEDPAWRATKSNDLGLAPNTVLDHIGRNIIAAASAMNSRAPYGLRLIPSLVLRHASGRLFQEAHATIESEQFGLFGESKIRTSPGFSPTGAYFTPVRIARVLTEWALKGWVHQKGTLTIADFACGSAVFLTEALRTLERFGFTGKVRLIGRDSSPQAITMAKVAIRNVERDLLHISVDTDILQADAFEGNWPHADVVLMNPPFRSWEKMNSPQREWVSQSVHKSMRGRPDLSVGFIERAMEALNANGTIATMIPAGVLSSDSLAEWRKSLAERAAPTLVAVLGEHGLFQHALVNVGMMTLEKTNPKNNHSSPLHIAWSAAELGSASKAIRALRRSISLSIQEPMRDSTGSWSVSTTSLSVWNERKSWLPGPGALGPLLGRIDKQIDTKVGDLFSVHQGIRTGANDAFLLSKTAVDRFPAREREYFHPAVVTESFANGEILNPSFIFIPDTSWSNDGDVEKAVPEFFNRHLKLFRDQLTDRKSLLDDRWWLLTRARPKWAFDGQPRLLSKRFGLFPAFARDMQGVLAPVQANAWVPKITKAWKGELMAEALTAYWWLLNSRVMVALLREYCPNVAGGQLDLENKFVKNSPLPNLPSTFETNPALQSLAASIRSRYQESLPPVGELDRFAAAAFGTDISDWNLTGLGV